MQWELRKWKILEVKKKKLTKVLTNFKTPAHESKAVLAMDIDDADKLPAWQEGRQKKAKRARTRQ